MPKKVHRQKRIKGGRDPVYSGVPPEIKKRVDILAREFNCSRSFVVVTFLGDALGVDVDRYYEIEDKRRKQARARAARERKRTRTARVKYGKATGVHVH